MTDRSEQAAITGHKGERGVAIILQRRGYKVEYDTIEDWDLLINDLLTVEVKTANLSNRADRPSGRWQFCLYSHPARQKPVDEDVLILRCESEPACHFIIPMTFVPHGLTKIGVTGPDPLQYAGKWSLFRECWTLIDLLLAEKEEGEHP